MQRPQPPKCESCDKFQAGFKNGWKYGNEKLFETYQLSKRFNCLPVAGGLNDQAPEMLEALYLLSLVEGNYEQSKSRSFDEFKRQYYK